MGSEHVLQRPRSYQEPGRGERFDAARVREASDGKAGVGELEQGRQPRMAPAGYMSRYLLLSGRLVAGGTEASLPSTYTLKLSLSTRT